MLTFITGGARSGKSRYAEELALRHAQDLTQPRANVTYIATAKAIDPEMCARIENHKARRPSSWNTIEAYQGVGKILEGLEGAVIVDCLTIMLTNIIMEAPFVKDGFDWDSLTAFQAQMLEDYALGEMQELADSMRKSRAYILLVSNELGMGLTPEYPLGRAFRDIAGRANALFAGMADCAVFMVSGLAMKLK